MTAWRMSLRVGNRGMSMWEKCRRRSVAAITYSPLARTNLSKHGQGEPSTRWAKLAPTQKASLERVAYEMRGGDVIYVREGDRIVGKGVVKGVSGARAYRFDSTFSLVDHNGGPWAHQVRVAWEPNFPEVENNIGRDQVTVKRLNPAEVGAVEKSIAIIHRKYVRKIQQREKKRAAPLAEDGYLRESSANKKIIIPRHNKLSNDLYEWLKNKHGVIADQEKKRVDVCFDYCKQNILAELKVCYRVGTTKGIREVLGQLFEYNHYPKRVTTDV
jgi:hypothetical protein